jgi:hypothetical protein
LTDKDIKKACDILLPQEDDGFKPYIKDKLLNKDIRAMEGEIISMVWKKKGYADIKKDINISESFNEESISIKPEDKYVSLDKNSFKVVDETRNPIDKAIITINNQKFDEKGIIKIPENKYSNAELKVSASGYETHKEKLSQSSNITITLKKTEHTYKFQTDIVYNRDGSKLEDCKLNIKITTIGKELKDFPAMDYKFKDDYVEEEKENKLSFVKNYKLKIEYFAYGVVGCLLIFMLFIGWKVFIEGYDFPSFQKHETPTAPIQSEEKKADTFKEQMPVATPSDSTSPASDNDDSHSEATPLQNKDKPKEENKKTKNRETNSSKSSSKVKKATDKNSPFGNKVNKSDKRKVPKPERGKEEVK